MRRSVLLPLLDADRVRGVSIEAMMGLAGKVPRDCRRGLAGRQNDTKKYFGKGREYCRERVAAKRLARILKQ
ncbi:hypothetical protein [Burkholderia gladioli]|jgi:hypothetical protein|uniref:hypothetical protein n=1 Tax=Burkholderia gladioli TaxID=28095 RepID=UPI001641ED92|nr:hypothetical protein [Burkholderia gladioli]MBU9319723.1 hypothetical protein [Burkholderia gladioli]